MLTMIPGETRVIGKNYYDLCVYDLEIEADYGDDLTCRQKSTGLLFWVSRCWLTFGGLDYPDHPHDTGRCIL